MASGLWIPQRQKQNIRPILLKELNLLTDNETEGKMENYVTNLPVRFKRVARKFLGREINHVSPVHLS